MKKTIRRFIAATLGLLMALSTLPAANADANPYIPPPPTSHYTADTDHTHAYALPDFIASNIQMLGFGVVFRSWTQSADFIDIFWDIRIPSNLAHFVGGHELLFDIALPANYVGSVAFTSWDGNYWFQVHLHVHNISTGALAEFHVIWVEIVPPSSMWPESVVAGIELAGFAAQYDWSDPYANPPAFAWWLEIPHDYRGLICCCNIYADIRPPDEYALSLFDVYWVDVDLVEMYLHVHNIHTGDLVEFLVMSINVQPPRSSIWPESVVASLEISGFAAQYDWSDPYGNPPGFVWHLEMPHNYINTICCVNLWVDNLLPDDYSSTVVSRWVDTHLGGMQVQINNIHTGNLVEFHEIWVDVIPPTSMWPYSLVAGVEIAGFATHLAWFDPYLATPTFEWRTEIPYAHRDLICCHEVWIDIWFPDDYAGYFDQQWRWIGADYDHMLFRLYNIHTGDLTEYHHIWIDITERPSPPPPSPYFVEHLRRFRGHHGIYGLIGVGNDAWMGSNVLNPSAPIEEQVRVGHVAVVFNAAHLTAAGDEHRVIVLNLDGHHASGWASIIGSGSPTNFLGMAGFVPAPEFGGIRFVGVWQGEWQSGGANIYWGNDPNKPATGGWIAIPYTLHRISGTEMQLVYLPGNARNPAAVAYGFVYLPLMFRVGGNRGEVALRLASNSQVLPNALWNIGATDLGAATVLTAPPTVAGEDAVPVYHDPAAIPVAFEWSVTVPFGTTVTPALVHAIAGAGFYVTDTVVTGNVITFGVTTDLAADPIVLVESHTINVTIGAHPYEIIGPDIIIASTGVNQAWSFTAPAGFMWGEPIGTLPAGFAFANGVLSWTGTAAVPATSIVLTGSAVVDGALVPLALQISVAAIVPPLIAPGSPAPIADVIGNNVLITVPGLAASVTSISVRASAVPAAGTGFIPGSGVELTVARSGADTFLIPGADLINFAGTAGSLEFFFRIGTQYFLFASTGAMTAGSVEGLTFGLSTPMTTPPAAPIGDAMGNVELFANHLRAFRGHNGPYGSIVVANNAWMGSNILNPSAPIEEQVRVANVVSVINMAHLVAAGFTHRTIVLNLDGHHADGWASVTDAGSPTNFLGMPGFVPAPEFGGIRFVGVWQGSWTMGSINVYWGDDPNKPANGSWIAIPYTLVRANDSELQLIYLPEDARNAIAGYGFIYLPLMFRVGDRDNVALVFSDNSQVLPGVSWTIGVAGIGVQVITGAAMPAHPVNAPIRQIAIRERNPGAIITNIPSGRAVTFENFGIYRIALPLEHAFANPSAFRFDWWGVNFGAGGGFMPAEGMGVVASGYVFPSIQQARAALPDAPALTGAAMAGIPEMMSPEMQAAWLNVNVGLLTNAQIRYLLGNPYMHIAFVSHPVDLDTEQALFVVLGNQPVVMRTVGVLVELRINHGSVTHRNIGAPAFGNVYATISGQGIFPDATAHIATLAFAGGHISLTAGEVVGGDYFEAVVSIEDNPGFGSMVLRVEVPAGLRLAGFELGHAGLYYGFEGPDVVADAAAIEDAVYFIWYDRNENFYYDGDLLILTFATEAGMAAGSLPIGLSFVNAKGDVDIPTNADKVPVFIGISGGSVLIRFIRVGDVNGDGGITSADATHLARYLHGGFGTVISHTIAADTNRDGVVCNKDLVLLVRWLIGLERP